MVTWCKNWWSRPYGGRAVMVIALPLIISAGSWQIMHFCDRLFLLGYDKVQMAASMPAGMMIFSLTCLPLGVASYANTFVGQYHGAGRPRNIGLAIWQGVFIGLIAFPCILATAPFIQHFFSLTSDSPLLVEYETTYYRIAALGSGGVIIAGALGAFYSGRGKPRPVMWVALMTAGINILLDYLLIFGYLGLPEMGIAGAALATSIAQWFSVAAYAFLLSRGNLSEKYGLREGRRFNWDLFLRFWRYGGPAGLQFFIEIVAFSGFVVLMGKISNDATAATALAFNMDGLAFIPMIGMGIAVAALVGQCLGDNRPRDARRVTWTALTIGLVYTGFFCILFLFWPNLLLSLHIWFSDPAEFEPIRQMTVLLMRFIAFFCMFDCCCAVLAGTLKGAGDTQYLFWVTALLAPTSTIIIGFGIICFGWGLVPCWWTVTIWISIQGILYFLRVLGPKWEKMRVIEPELLPTTPAESGGETVQVF